MNDKQESNENKVSEMECFEDCTSTRVIALESELVRSRELNEELEKELIQSRRFTDQLEEDITEILSIVDRYSLLRKCIWRDSDKYGLTELYNHFITALTLKCKPKHKERVERLFNRKVFSREDAQDE